MKLSSEEMLKRLGSGECIAAVCEAAGISRAQFESWWLEETRRRVPRSQGTRRLAGLHRSVRIERDERGLPHILADNDRDLFFGFGYAVGQDRLFQLDYLRRKATGRLAEVLGPEAIESDTTYRTIGLAQIAEKEWTTLPEEVRALTSAYTAGINALMLECRDCLPIEFDLLDYKPGPWRETDSLAIIGEFRWYLTGRFPVIAIPELAKRTLGDGLMLREFLLAEIDEESILQPGEYAVRRAPDGPEQVASLAGAEGPGSNNWVLGGYRTDTGKPLVANDPHIPYAAVSIWHEVHLRGGSFNVAGAALAGMPAVMIGRNEHLAFGITNNICSQRDLYHEQTDPTQPGCYLYEGKWELAQVRHEAIHVRGHEPVRTVIRSSRNGPIVDDILPAPARHTGPVSLRWLGFEPCGWLTALLGMDRARTCEELRRAAEPWICPTFNLVFADLEGNVGFQSVGRIPLRKSPERGYRPGWVSEHQWAGVIRYAEMPGLINPKRGFVVTANNRLAPVDFAYPLAGCWNSGHRSRRLRQQIEAKRVWSREDTRRLQLDLYSGRAALGVSPLITALEVDPDLRVQQAISLLRGWNYHIRADSPAATLFNVFFANWCRTVSQERFPVDVAPFMSTTVVGLAARLLVRDAGWFERDRMQAIRATFQATLDELTSRLGADMQDWKWGVMHVLTQPHFLSRRGNLGQLLDLTGMPCGGDGATVNAGTMDASFGSVLGAGYRMVAELADPDAGFWSIEVAGASGHVGSPHYADQIEPWSAGELHYTPLRGEIGGVHLTLEPLET